MAPPARSPALAAATLAAAAASAPRVAEAHGHLTLPASSRHGGDVRLGGDCANEACFWFSNNVEIPAEPTLPDAARSVNANATGAADIYSTSPWRAPGSAPVFGSGCGAGGGGPTAYANGGYIKSAPQGKDGAALPAVEPVEWTAGDVVEVGFAIAANHGGGYQYRVCRVGDDGDASDVTEACFQRTPLPFAGTTSAIAWPDGTRKEFARYDVTEGVTPKGFAWARDPVPGCTTCDPYSSCGAPLPPVPGFVKSDWDDWVNCCAMCDGAGESKGSTGACESGTHFPEPAEGISGFGKSVWPWSVVDSVRLPKDLPEGRYLLSWRWDCEESTQVWQNCADVRIAAASEDPTALSALAAAVPRKAGVSGGAQAAR